MIGYLPTQEDLQHVSGSAAQAVDKCQRLHNGQASLLLQGLEAELQMASKGKQPKPSPQRFMIQLWDGNYLGKRFGYYLLDTPQQREQLALRFNTIHVDDWSCRPRLRPDVARFVEEQSVALIAGLRSYTNARFPIGETLQAAGSPNAYVDCRTTWWGGTYRRPNVWNGDTLELLIKALLLETANRIAVCPTLVGVMLETEKQMALGDCDVVNLAAEKEGVSTSPLQLWPPETEEPWSKIVSTRWPVLRSLLWHWKHRNHVSYFRWIQRLGQKVWPGLHIVKDCQYHPRDAEAVDDLQSWVFVNCVGSSPLATAYAAEQARAKCHATASPRILVGAQLGTTHNNLGTGQQRACPAHLFGTAWWAALAACVRGGVHWGLTCMFDECGQFRPNGTALWTLLKRVCQQVVEPLGQLPLQWLPTERQVAILVPVVDQICESGRGADPSGNSPRTRAYLRAIPNVFEACWQAGYLPDLVYGLHNLDQIASHRAVIIPCLYVPTTQDMRILEQYLDRRGVVITHSGLLATQLGIGGLHLLDRQYLSGLAAGDLSFRVTANGPETCMDRQEFLRQLAIHLREAVPVNPVWHCPDNSDVVLSQLRYEDTRYWVLVNNSFKAGEEERWYYQTTGKSYKYHDLGRPVSIANATKSTLVDVLSGETFALNQPVGLEPGWGRVLQEIPTR